MSINKLVSIDNVIINLLDDLALDHTKYKPMFTNWAVTAEKKIGSYYQYVRKHCVLIVSNCVVELPLEAAVLELAILGDYGSDCGDLFARVGSCVGNITSAPTGTGFLVVDLPDVNNYSIFNQVNYHVQDNKIIFDRNVNGQTVTIQYLGLKSDSYGIPMIGENHIEAIGEYCMYKFRRRRVKNSNDIGMYRDHKKEWESLCIDARAEDAMLTESDQRQISDMINDPFAGRGLKLIPTGYYGTY